MATDDLIQWQTEIERWKRRIENSINPKLWRDVTYTSSWATQADYPSVAYYKDPFGIVHMRGVAEPSGTETTVCILPEGFRPSVISIFPITYWLGSNYFPGQTVVGTDGQIQIDNYESGAIDASSSLYPFNGIYFRVI